MIVIIEGLDGVGKTTQIQKLSERFFNEDIPSTIYREPGSTELGELIRSNIFKSEILSKKINPISALFLMEASRASLCEFILNKYTNEELYGYDHIIILDRFTASTYAYQGSEMKLKQDMHGYIFSLIREINNLATFSLKPSLSIFLELDLKTIESRLNEKEKSTQDRFESMGMPFYKKVNSNYMQYMYETSWKENWVILNTDNQSIDQVHESLYNTIIEHRNKLKLGT